MLTTSPQGSLPAIIRNDAGLYEDNLVYYFQVVFNRAQNLIHPYHNFRHMTHITWLCHNAVEFYLGNTRVSRRGWRELLIAGLFHDFDHSGMMGHDDLNIERALRGLRTHILPQDAPYIVLIEHMIKGTQFPYVIPSQDLTLGGLILRDADMSQALSVAWIQQVVFGLAGEWGKTPKEILKMQEPFLKSLKFNTDWARHQFPKADVLAKIQEARDLLELLERPVAVAA